jgi:processive 1,2-diacylglycerol beta-glucosyltransferase
LPKGPVLFLSARVGEGHRAAADAVRGRLAARGIRGEVVDSYRYAASLFSKVVSDGYIGMVRTIPQLYGFIYDRAERATAAGGFRVWASEFTARNIRRLIERTKPSAVVCTHAFPCGVMSAYKRLYDPSLPVMGIVTDFVVHPFWIYKNVDAYAVATPEICAAMIARGIDPERIGVDGIPVDPRFAALPSDRAGLREMLGLPRDAAVALVMGGGLGLGPVAATVRALAAASVPVTPVVIVGKNKRLERRFADEARREGGDVRVLGFVENVFDWMHAADVLVTKPGGLTTSEALAARLPMVLLRPLPGQEERNARYLVSRGAALRARNPRELVRVVGAVLHDDATAERLRTGAASFAHPDAAEHIAERIAALAQGAPERAEGAAADEATPGGTTKGRLLERWPSG